MYRQTSNDTARCRKPKKEVKTKRLVNAMIIQKNRKRYRLAKPTGLEPVTSGVTGRCSDQIEL